MPSFYLTISFRDLFKMSRIEIATIKVDFSLKCFWWVCSGGNRVGGGKVRVIVKLCKVAILILISVGSYFLVRFSDLISLSILLLTIYHLPFNLQGCNSHPNLSWILFWVRFSDLISLSILLLTIYRDRSEARIMTRGRQYIHGHRASMLAGVITLHC